MKKDAVSSIKYTKNKGAQLGDAYFKYDANGNMIEFDNKIPEQDFNRRLIWDEQNRLQAVV